MEPEDAIATNLASWDQRTPVHLRSPEYRTDLKTLRAGGTCLLPPTDTEIGDVAGKRLLHLQCHIGTDTLSLARMGAAVTGLDFSSAALDAARGFADELGLAARFIQADAQHADEALPGEQFDVVFASFGVFCWIPDVVRWMASAARLLAPGGVLYVADGHPFMDVLEDDPAHPHGFDVHYSYFRREPLRFGPGPSYADDGSRAEISETVEYIHPLGEIVTGVAAAGLTVQYVHEHPGCFFRRCATMQPDDVGRYDFPQPLRGKLPMVFSLRARKP